MSYRLLGMVIELALLREVIAVLLEAKPAMVVSGLVRKADKNTSAQGVFAAAGGVARDNPQLFLRTAAPATAGAACAGNVCLTTFTTRKP